MKGYGHEFGQKLVLCNDTIEPHDQAHGKTLESKIQLNRRTKAEKYPWIFISTHSK